MITVNFMGGLGNQLFQVFALIAYSLRYGHMFVFPYTTILDGKRKTYWEDFLEPIKQYTTYNSDYGFNAQELYNFETVYYVHHHYQEIQLLPRNQNIKIYGYFQSYKYFEDQKQKIFDIIGLDKTIEKIKHKYESLFSSNDYIISMHFRLGDYKNIQDYHNLLPYQYYEKSLKHILEKNSSNSNNTYRVYYFCEPEDNEVVKNMINSLSFIWPNIQYIKVDDKIEDWEQMLIMSFCHSNIIANSTFSWWAAYFNQNRKKIVCYPSVWFGPNLAHHYMGDMFPSDWKKIEL